MRPDTLDLDVRRVDIIQRYFTIRSTYAKPDCTGMVRFTIPDNPERAVFVGDAGLLRILASECKSDERLTNTYLRKIQFLCNRVEEVLRKKNILWADGY